VEAKTVGQSAGARFAASGAADDRILFALSLTQRPLHSLELANALGLDVQQSGDAFRRLVRKGYIQNVERDGQEAGRIWSLSEKGRLVAAKGGDGDIASSR
jgi:hypothetical protein